MPDPRALPRPARVVLAAALALAALGGLAALWREGATGVGIDHFQYWAAGQSVRERLVPDIYRPDAAAAMARIFGERAASSGEPRYRAAASFRGDEIQIASTPFLFALVNLVPETSFERAIARHRALGLAGTLGALVALGIWLGWPVEGILAFVAFAAWFLQPWRDDLLDGNVNGWQMALLATALGLARSGGPAWRSLAAGAVLGLAVIFKPNLAAIPAVLALAWLLRRRHGALLRRGAGFVLGAAAAVAAGSLWFGTPSVWLSWLRTLKWLEVRFDVGVGWGNFAAGRLMWDAFGVNATPILAAGTFALIAVALWLGRHPAPSGPAARRGGHSPGAPPFEEDLLLVGIGAILPILSSGLAWPHYLVLALPLVMRLLTPSPPSAAVRAGAAAGLALIASTPALQALGVRSDYVLAGALLGGTTLLFLLGCWELARVSAEVPAPGGVPAVGSSAAGPAAPGGPRPGSGPARREPGAGPRGGPEGER